MRYRRPFGDMLGLTEEMRRLLDLAWEAQEIPARRGVWSPPVDISETPDDVRIQIDLPGFTSENLDVTVERNILTIQGERQPTAPGKDGKYLRIERPSGTCRRSIGLPEGTLSEKVSASMKDGVLTIVIPKGSSSKPRKIAITSDDK